MQLRGLLSGTEGMKKLPVGFIARNKPVSGVANEIWLNDGSGDVRSIISVA